MRLPRRRIPFALFHKQSIGRSTDFNIEIEQEEDGRWLAEVIELPGVLAYGESAEKAMIKVEALALRVISYKTLKLLAEAYPHADKLLQDWRKNIGP